MRYALLIFEKPGSYDGFDDDARRAITAEYMDIAGEDRVLSGAHLRPPETATTVRAGDGDGDLLTTDGPFADTKEVFGGWFVLEADDLDGALEVAGRIPAIRMGGSVEVRPIVEEPR
jgi:hypothetical protein